LAPHLVRVNVVVRDHAGNPVAGLTRDDFILLDDGRPQAIQEFAAVTNQPVDQYTPVIPADTFSNRLEDHQRTADSATIVLLDGINTRFEDPEYARRQTVKFLEQIEAGDHVAVCILGRELRVLQDFSDDGAKLVAELKKHQAEPAAAMDDTLPRERLGYHIEAAPRGKDLLDAFLYTNARLGATFEGEPRLRVTAEALAAIANHLAALPGRKALIWVTGEIPPLLHPVGYRTHARSAKNTLQAEVEEAVRALNAADVGVYPVDARGLMQPEQMQQRASLRSEAAEDEMTRRVMMNDWATFTGGRELERPAGIFGAIRAAVADSAASYELGYYADAAGGEETVHFFAVSVRQMGVQVYVRRGYVQQGPLELAPQERRAVLANAASSPLDATGVGMGVQVKGATVAGAQLLEARVQFDAQDVAFAQREGAWTGAVDVVFVQLDAKNRIVDSSDETFDLKFSPERFRQVVKDRLNYSKRIVIEGDAATLRVVVRDATTGAMGSVTIPVERYVGGMNAAN
jgi:VWFA-related protein